MSFIGRVFLAVPVESAVSRGGFATFFQGLSGLELPQVNQVEIHCFLLSSSLCGQIV